MHHIIMTTDQATVSNLKYTEENEQKIYMYNADLLTLLQNSKSAQHI